MFGKMFPYVGRFSPVPRGPNGDVKQPKTATIFGSI
jgi:hypothetical protein